MDTLKPCPFCNSSPVFPESKDVYGTYYDAGCDDCGIPTISIQIIDCFDHPRQHVHDSWNSETIQYGIEFIEVARQEAVEAWNKRTSEWVSVEDRLPFSEAEMGGEPYKTQQVIAVTRFGDVFPSEFKRGKTYSSWWSFDDDPKGYITHWMPLPQPPKGDE